MSRLLIRAFVFASIVSAQTKWSSARPDGHAPIGVMADHTHEKGEVMLSCRWMFMGMEDSRVGSDEVSNSDIVSPNGYNFLVTPLRMHMLGAMYAPADRVTLMGMVNILCSTMDYQTRPGGMFTTESRGAATRRSPRWSCWRIRTASGSI